MPLPENSRLTFYKYMPETPTDHFANLRETDRWGSQLPVFGQALKKIASVGSWNTSSTTYTNFGGAGFVRISNFKKYHSWTNLFVRVFASGYMNTVNLAECAIRLTGASSGIQTDQYITKQYFNTTVAHTNFGGELLFESDTTPSTAKIADTYTVDLMIRVGVGGTFITDANDDVSLSIIECIP